jgi:hypothetical protein
LTTCCGTRSTGRTTGNWPDEGAFRRGSFAGRITGARGSVAGSRGCAKRAEGSSLGRVGVLRTGFTGAWIGCTVFLKGSVGPAPRAGGSLPPRCAETGRTGWLRAAGSPGRGGVAPRAVPFAPAVVGTSLTRSSRGAGRDLRRSCICFAVSGWPCWLAITF